MVKIYTRTGDEGETGLFGGTRVPKNDWRIDAYGSLDELNSFVGQLRSFLSNKSPAHDELLEVIQGELFVLGSHLATEAQKRDDFKLPLLDPALIRRLEKAMDDMNKKLPELKNFVLPAGGQAASAAHVCRTVCRRVERKVTALLHQEENQTNQINGSIPLLNRLSDYFFVLARSLNHEEGAEEKLWKGRS